VTCPYGYEQDGCGDGGVFCDGCSEDLDRHYDMVVKSAIKQLQRHLNTLKLNRTAEHQSQMQDAYQNLCNLLPPLLPSVK
jgi:hypothetical protein